MAMMDQELPKPAGSRFPDQSGNSGFVPTQNELDKISSAIQDPTFRSMLVDYANQMNDPNNRRTYEVEMVALEAQRGVKCTFLHPRPGYVIKTRCLCTQDQKGGKAFVNVCFDDNVGEPSLSSSPPPTPSKRTKTTVSRKRSGQCWSLPYFQSQPHPERDSNGKECEVYDVIFNPLAETKAAEDPRFKRLLDTTSLDAVEQAFDVKFDRQNIRFPKLKFKGSFRPTVIREPLNQQQAATQPRNQQDEAPSEKKLKENAIQQFSQEVDDGDSKFVTPTYAIKYKTVLGEDLPTQTLGLQKDPTRPTHLAVDICLSGLASAKAVDLDVTERSLVLECAENCSPRYRLDLPLPYAVSEHEGAAKFDKVSGTLQVTLPVKPAPPVQQPVARLISTDSGIGLETDEEEESPMEVASKPVSKKDEPVSRKSDALLPPYTCNIYEDLMVFKLDVKNVRPDSLTKDSLADSTGFSLSFENVGSGMVPLKYTFVFAMEDSSHEKCDILDRAEIDVWDNNVIVQFAVPLQLAACRTYKVGADLGNMTEHPLPQLKEFRMKKDQLKHRNEKRGLKDVTNIDGGKKSICANAEQQQSLTSEDYDSSDDKERHSSGESVDSALSFSLSSVTSGGDDSVPKRGILKHPKRCVRRCFSESHAATIWNNSALIEAISEISEEDEETSHATSHSHSKKVSFNEVVKRQVFKSGASILGQKNKGVKKAEQKARKEAKRTRSLGSIEGMRRASEGDAAFLEADGFKISSSFESCLKTDKKLISSSPRGKGAKVDDTTDEEAELGHHEDGHDSGVASSYEEHHHATPNSTTANTKKTSSKKVLVTWRNPLTFPKVSPSPTTTPTLAEALSFRIAASNLSNAHCRKILATL